MLGLFTPDDIYFDIRAILKCRWGCEDFINQTIRCNTRNTSYLLTFTLTRKDGGTTWALLTAGDGSYNLDIIDEAAFKKQLTFDAEEMKKSPFYRDCI